MKVLPTPKANRSAIRKVIKATENKHKKLDVNLKIKTKASQKTGLLNRTK